MRRFLFLCFSLLFAISAQAMSEKKEAKIGKEMYDDIVAEMAIYEEPKMVEYVNKVGEKVAKVSDRPNSKFTFTIIDSPDINAFATPGGYIYINRGLITYMKSEAQLAAVLAHEIGHVTAEHAARQQRAATTNQAVAGLLGILTGSGEVAEASALWGQTMVSGYGRDMELEADQLGAQYLFNASYPPTAMIEVISILKDNERFEKRRAKETGKKKQSYHGLFATHPRNDKRLQEVIQRAGELSNNLDADANIDPFREATEGLPWGKNFKKPIRKDNRFYNEKLRFYFDYPEGWQFVDQGKTIIGTSPDQKYRVTLEIRKRTKDSPDQFIKKSLGYSLIKKSEAFTQAKLKGHRGFVSAGDGKPDQRIAVIYYSRYAYVFRGELLQGNDLKAADELFLGIIRSFRPLSARSLKSKEAKVIHYVRATKNFTFKKLAAYLKMGKFGEDQLRLINGYYPIGEPKPGEWVKIIR